MVFMFSSRFMLFPTFLETYKTHMGYRTHELTTHARTHVRTHAHTHIHTVGSPVVLQPLHRSTNKLFSFNVKVFYFNQIKSKLFSVPYNV